MSKKAINRLKAVLAEQSKTNKWLAEQLGKNENNSIAFGASTQKSAKKQNKKRLK